MEDIVIKKQNALTVYRGTGTEGKTALEKLCGSEIFNPKNIIEQINDFADICRLCGTTEEKFFKACHDAGLERDEVAYRQMKMLTRAYNQGWVPDYNNTSERKWVLCFWLNDPGFRLLDAVYVDTVSYVGARLCFKTEELALDAAKKFHTIYETYYTLNAEAKAEDTQPSATSNDPFERDCLKLGYDHTTIIPDLSKIPEDLQAPVRSYIRLLVGTAAKRDNHKFDYQNYEERKWYPWWDMEVEENNPSGFRLHAAYCGRTYSFVGARLSLRTEEEVREVVEEYFDDYRNMMKQ